LKDYQEFWEKWGLENVRVPNFRKRGLKLGECYQGPMCEEGKESGLMEFEKGKPIGILRG